MSHPSRARRPTSARPVVCTPFSRAQATELRHDFINAPIALRGASTQERMVWAVDRFARQHPEWSGWEPWLFETLKEELGARPLEGMPSVGAVAEAQRRPLGFVGSKGRV